MGDQAGGAYSYESSSIQIKQGVYFNMTRLESNESYSSEGTCVTIDDSDYATSAATRQEAYTLKDFTEEDFTLRTPFTPTFCFSTETPLLQTASPTASPTALPTAPPTPPTASPTASPTCTDVGNDNIPLTAGMCPSWVANNCDKSWATTACPCTCQ